MHNKKYFSISNSFKLLILLLHMVQLFFFKVEPLICLNTSQHIFLAPDLLFQESQRVVLDNAEVERLGVQVLVSAKIKQAEKEMQKINMICRELLPVMLNLPHYAKAYAHFPRETIQRCILSIYNYKIPASVLKNQEKVIPLIRILVQQNFFQEEERIQFICHYFSFMVNPEECKDPQYVVASLVKYYSYLEKYRNDVEKIHFLLEGCMALKSSLRAESMLIDTQGNEIIEWLAMQYESGLQKQQELEKEIINQQKKIPNKPHGNAEQITQIRAHIEKLEKIKKQQCNYLPHWFFEYGIHPFADDIREIKKFKDLWNVLLRFYQMALPYGYKNNETKYVFQILKAVFSDGVQNSAYAAHYNRLELLLTWMNTCIESIDQASFHLLRKIGMSLGVYSENFSQDLWEILIGNKDNNAYILSLLKQYRKQGMHAVLNIILDLVAYEKRENGISVALPQTLIIPYLKTKLPCSFAAYSCFEYFVASEYKRMASMMSEFLGETVNMPGGQGADVLNEKVQQMMASAKWDGLLKLMIKEWQTLQDGTATRSLSEWRARFQRAITQNAEQIKKGYPQWSPLLEQYKISLEMAIYYFMQNQFFQYSLDKACEQVWNKVAQVKTALINPCVSLEEMNHMIPQFDVDQTAKGLLAQIDTSYRPLRVQGMPFQESQLLSLLFYPSAMHLYDSHGGRQKQESHYRDVLEQSRAHQGPGHTTALISSHQAIFYPSINTILENQIIPKSWNDFFNLVLDIQQQVKTAALAINAEMNRLDKDALFNAYAQHPTQEIKAQIHRYLIFCYFQEKGTAYQALEEEMRYLPPQMHGLYTQVSLCREVITWISLHFAEIVGPYRLHSVDTAPSQEEKQLVLVAKQLLELPADKRNSETIENRVQGIWENHSALVRNRNSQRMLDFLNRPGIQERDIVMYLKREKMLKQWYNDLFIKIQREIERAWERKITLKPLLTNMPKYRFGGVSMHICTDVDPKALENASYYYDLFFDVDTVHRAQASVYGGLQVIKKDIVSEDARAQKITQPWLILLGSDPHLSLVMDIGSSIGLYFCIRRAYELSQELGCEGRIIMPRDHYTFSNLTAFHEKMDAILLTQQALADASLEGYRAAYQVNMSGAIWSGILFVPFQEIGYLQDEKVEIFSSKEKYNFFLANSYAVRLGQDLTHQVQEDVARADHVKVCA